MLAVASKKAAKFVFQRLASLRNLILDCIPSLIPSFLFLLSRVVIHTAFGETDVDPESDHMSVAADAELITQAAGNR